MVCRVPDRLDGLVSGVVLVITALIAFGCGFLVGVSATVVMIIRLANFLVSHVLDKLRGELGR